MKAHLFTVLIAALVTAPAVLAAPPGPGPFTGTVREGQTDRHRYDNDLQDIACIQIVVPYTVTLTYAPTTDVLTLSAGGQTAVGSNGLAAVTFEAGYCTSFLVRVTGTDVATVASYAVIVTQGTGIIPL